MDLTTFVGKWQKSRAEERSNKDGFLYDLADVLGVPRPEPKTGDRERDRYVFEHDVPTLLEDGQVTTRKIDLYKHDSFILEAKQGSEPKDPKEGFARRRTPKWDLGMSEAYGQATGYASSMDDPPPFLVICDIGYCFDLYASFDRTPHRPFPNALRKRIWFKDLLTEPKHLDTLRAIWTDPRALDPARYAAKITREVAASIADLARSLEEQGHPPEVVAKFLMRCLFTMFAASVGLLPERSFARMIEDYWLPNPPSFASAGGVPALWRTMNHGGSIPLLGDILRFNGGLFADTSALPLKKKELEALLKAAKRDWAEVEPAIFGTLLERALSAKERHKLGAHFTPRAYVERLVRPTIEEPLREEWENVQAAARKLRRDEKAEEARQLVHEYLRKLCGLRVLDPACGTGNFLYVALDLFKRIESEVLALLRELGEVQEKLHIEGERVTPKQFLGIEVKPWAKEIAELVLWIGYLQWHYKSHGKGLPPAEPVLAEYQNIECRDAVLAWDKIELVTDERGKPVTRWDGETYKKSPVTGEDVPDETARAPVYKYLGVKKAMWPEADFVLGNPPFIGNKRMRLLLSSAYVDALRQAYDAVPDTADYVMYWWHKAAALTEANEIRRFGLITTNSITQTFNRKVIEPHLRSRTPISIVFAIPDHPWVDAQRGAAVRIGMTVAQSGDLPGDSLLVIKEEKGEDIEVKATLEGRSGKVHSDLTVGANVVGATRLRANAGVCFQGVILVGDGFRIEPPQVKALGYNLTSLPPIIRRTASGKDVVQHMRDHYVIDLYGLSEEDVQKKYPQAYQYLYEAVRPHRLQNRDAQRRARWWLFGRSNEAMRRSVERLQRYVSTVETSKYKVFVFLDGEVCPDHKLYVIASDDALLLGVLSSRVHVSWALAAGGRLGVGNDPTWTNSTCFLPFPFPVCTKAHQIRIRALGEQLDAHRKRRQAQHTDLTITGMYNVLEKLRKGEPLSEKDKIIHEHGLISVLKKIHDDLDAAVFAAYGWPADLTDEQILQKLVDLNAERTEEERKGQIRWLRPDFQNPAGARPATQEEMTETKAAEETGAATGAKAWPKKVAERIAAVRDCITAWGRSASAEEVAASFKRAPRKDVEEMLDSLAAVGVLTVLETERGKRWKAITRTA